jgi:hypothetical protein
MFPNVSEPVPEYGFELVPIVLESSAKFSRGAESQGPPSHI